MIGVDTRILIWVGIVVLYFKSAVLYIKEWASVVEKVKRAETSFKML